MCSGKQLLLTLAAWVSCATAWGAPTLVEHVQGYTLAANRLETFTGLVFDAGKVLEVGDAAELRKKYTNAALVDGHGKTLLPGLIDAHGHVFDLGAETVEIQLEETRSLAEAQARIRAYAAANAQRPWLLGAGWNQEIWKLGRFPLATELDAVVADKPVVLDRVDGHAKWLNSQALRAAGITQDTRDPPGGRIERDAAGNPSGVLVDKAMLLVEKVIPQPSAADLRDALKAALSHMNAVGLTGVGDAGINAAQAAVYRQMADEGLLTVRIYAMIRDTGADFRTLSKQGPLIGYAHDTLNIRAVKLFADGALGSRGAALLAP